MTLRQREPRIRDNKHLDFIRSLPCCICGGIDTEAAHIRTASLEHGKSHTGMQERPSDIWSLPLCNRHHREQHGMNEMSFWAQYQINPFALAITLRKPK
jgi:Putative HNHc nuclease